MINEEDKLKKFIEENNIQAEHVRFDKSLHSVQDTMRVTGFTLNQIAKTIIFKTKTNKTIAAIIPAVYRVSITKLKKATGINDIELAEANQAYELTGYPIGGMPSFGYNAIFVMDPKIMENENIYTGGGSEFSLTKINIKELTKINQPIIKKITGNKSN